MTKREAAVIGAYTGILVGKFSDMQTYVEGLLGRPVFTHELGDKAFTKKIKELAKPDFLDICGDVK